MLFKSTGNRDQLITRGGIEPGGAGRRLESSIEQAMKIVRIKRKVSIAVAIACSGLRRAVCL